MERFKELGIADRVNLLLNWQPSHRALLSPEQFAGVLDPRPQLCFNEDSKSADQAALDGARFCLTTNWAKRSPTWRSRWFRHSSPFAPRRRRGIGFSNFSICYLSPEPTRW
jgi:hypothetical protein